MDQALIKKADLKKLLTAVSEKVRVFAPVKTPDGVVLSALSQDSDVTVDYFNFDLPAKDLFLPQTETLYTYGKDTVPKAVIEDKPFVVFGIRPCDVSGILRLDDVYEKLEPADPYYQARRKNGLIISMACTTPRQTCFCTSMGGGPSESAGSDVMAFEVDGSLLLEACSDKGKAFLGDWKDQLDKADDTAKKAAAEQKDAIKKKVPTVKVDGVTPKLVDQFDANVWDKQTQACLSCGTCTFYCPTCQCFGIYDEPCAEGHRRLRCWDACMLLTYSKEASGHNPRGVPGERYRQRIMHKLRYTVENYDNLSCVGCGRCVRKCPVNIDIRETIAEVMG